jgi:hypothetical protein
MVPSGLFGGLKTACPGPPSQAEALQRGRYPPWSFSLGDLLAFLELGCGGGLKRPWRFPECPWGISQAATGPRVDLAPPRGFRCGGPFRRPDVADRDQPLMALWRSPLEECQPPPRSLAVMVHVVHIGVGHGQLGKKLRDKRRNAAGSHNHGLISPGG